MNISLIVSSHAEIFCSGLLQLLWENPLFRGYCVITRSIVFCFQLISLVHLLISVSVIFLYILCVVNNIAMRFLHLKTSTIYFIK
jgi:hypothetical protein